MTIEERIERLERTNRRYRLMFTLIGVIAVCAVGISATQDGGVPDVIQAKAFEVVDDEGNVVVRLTEAEGVDVIAILDKTTEEVLVVITSPTIVGKEKRAGIVITFCEGKRLVGVTFDKSGMGMVTTFDDQEKELVAIGSTGGDGGRLAVYNRTGEEVCTLAVDEYGNGVIGAWDRNGKGRTLKPGP